MPFPEVIRGFVEDGLNKSQVGDILGFERGDFYRKLKGLSRAGIDFDWPDPYDSRWTVEYRATPARLQAREAALAKARLGVAERWDRERKGTAALSSEAAKIRASGVSWLVVASRLGVAPSTLLRARKQHPIHDPVGNRLVREAQRKFKVKL